MSMPVKEILIVGEDILTRGGVPEAKLQAEQLLTYISGMDSMKLFMNWVKELSDDICEAYFSVIRRRADGEPLQYITGTAPFMGFEINVDRRALIPRLDTEILAEKAIETAKALPKLKSALELCAGTGAVTIALLKALPKLSVTAADISQEALSLASENYKHLGVYDRVSPVKSDLFAALPQPKKHKAYGLVIANPPYIKSADISGLMREVRGYEPLLALDGGEDGLDFYRRIAAEAPDFMSPGAPLLLEIGADQADDVTRILEDTGRFGDIEITKDLAGLDRVVKAKAL